MSGVAELPPRSDEGPAEPLADDVSVRLAAAPDARPPWSPRRAFFTVLALFFFAGPLLLYLTGQHGKRLSEERTIKPPGLAQGWSAFDEATQYITQQLPLRSNAVTADNWISNNIFSSPPRYGAAVGSDQALPFGEINAANANGGYAQNGGAQAGHPVVAVGRDHWIFLQGELDTACSPPVDFDTAVQRWDTFIRTIRASGRRVVLLITPEKSTIYPEYVAPNTISWRCAQPHKSTLWSKIEALRNPDFRPLRQPLLAEKRADPSRLLYLPLDSHWNDLGGLLLVKEALSHVGGAVHVSPGDAQIVPERYKGDISAFTGTIQYGIAPTVTIHRAGNDRVTVTAQSPYGVETVHPGHPGTVIPGTTLFLHDSYGNSSQLMLEHYAAKLIELQWLASPSPSQISQGIRQAHTIIIETVERDFLKRAASVLTPAVLSSLPQELR